MGNGPVWKRGPSGHNGRLGDGPLCVRGNEGASSLIVLVAIASNEHLIDESEPLVEGTFASVFSMQSPNLYPSYNSEYVPSPYLELEPCWE